MSSNEPKDADNNKREQRPRRMNRLGGAMMAAVFGLIAFFGVVSNPRFQTIHTLDVIRLMTAGAGAAVSLMLLFDFCFPGPRSESKKERDQGTS